MMSERVPTGAAVPVEQAQHMPEDAAPATAVGEYHTLPPQVDFMHIAAGAIEVGIFKPHPDMVECNTADAPGFRFPEALLERPYESGRSEVQLRQTDVPVALMTRIRKNMVAANRIIMPSKLLLPYFHERFTSPDVFQSEGIEHAVREHKLLVLATSAAQDSSLSFQVEGVDRTVHNRELFTNEEAAAGVELARYHPAVALAVYGYQGIILDYLQGVGGAFSELAAQPNQAISEQDLEDYQKFVELWDTSNFVDTILPAAAIYLRIAQQNNPEQTAQSLLTQELFQNAVNFVVKNGTFRNFIAVPASVATDGKERVNHFLCPAVNIIREQLIDGSLLHAIYSVTATRLESGDPHAVALAQKIQTGAEATLENARNAAYYKRLAAEEAARPTVVVETEGRAWSDIAASAIRQALEKDKPAVFTVEGAEYSLTPDAIEAALLFHEEKHDGDEELDLYTTTFLYGALQEAAIIALESNRAVFFRFVGTPYRIDPARIKTLFQQIAR